MRSGIVLAAVLAVVTGVEAQTVPGLEDLHVRTGETLTIGPDRLSIRVDNWEMDDNSTIIIPSGVCGQERCTWRIDAQTATIGSGVRILGGGVNGTNGGSSGHNGSDAGGRCNDGRNGGPGDHGLPGGHGIDVNITMGLLSFGDLLIDVEGGRGGNGAIGGSGGVGTRGSCSSNCRGGRGGDGGQGGKAGAGGDGGNINIAYWLPSVGSPVMEPVEGQNLITKTQGGRPGNPGDGGRLGAGGGSSGRCGIWPSYWRRGGGGNGRPGGIGSVALPGRNGTVEVVPRTAP